MQLYIQGESSVLQMKRAVDLFEEEVYGEHKFIELDSDSDEPEPMSPGAGIKDLIDVEMNATRQ